MRGGTSKAVMFRLQDLPPDRRDWDEIFLGIMGSPDPSGRQLDGMGGGVSSLSKVCVIGPSSRPDADVDYTFAQISIKENSVDYRGNCGNMSSAVGPFAVDEGLVKRLPDGEATVRIFNTNTSKIIVSRFDVTDGLAEVDGDLTLDGVAGSGAPVRLEFMEPGGSSTGRLMPTGRVKDSLEVPGLGKVEASLFDASNACVFVRATDLGKTGGELPDALEGDPEFLSRMEAIRQAASVAMGLAPDLASAAKSRSVPKVAMVCAPRAMPTLSGRETAATAMTIGIRMMSMGQAHRAVPITGSICLASAVRVIGSIPNALSGTAKGPIVIAHPSGAILVDSEVEHPDDPQRARVVHGAVYRTARRLFEGHVFCRGKQSIDRALRTAAE